MEIRVWHQIHGDFVEIDIEDSFKSHRAGKVGQEVGYDVVHLVVGFAFLSYFTGYLSIVGLLGFPLFFPHFNL